jgi:hypothetical protein
MRRILASALILFALGTAIAPALEIKSGIVKVVIDESNARISVYKLVDVAKGRFEPLLFDIDPRTSYASLSFAGRISKLGDSAEYRFVVTKTELGARIEFRSAYCLVTEDLDFVTSAGSALADGIKLSFTVTNLSQQDAAIGMRLVLDTWLGEKGGTHFKTDLQPRISEESSLTAASADSWIESPGDKASMMVVLKGSGFPSPDKVVLANWKRLNDESWSYAAVSGRSFTLLPYSVNDSALALYWMPAELAKGTSRTYSTILGVFNEKGFPAGGSTGGTSALYAQALSGQVPTDPAAAMAQDLLTARDLVAKIDQAIASGKPLSAEEIAAWLKILDSLEERKKGY